MTEAEHALPLAPEEARALPVFPLPSAILLPGSLMALHLFEPRYRALAKACLDEGPRAMAVAVLLPGYERDYHGWPAIAPLAGAGRIVAHRAQPDGTYDLLLAGIGRVELDEIADRSLPFRRARATTVVEPELDAALEAEVTSLVALAAAIPTPARLLPIPPPELVGPPGLRIDLLCDRYFPADVAVRRSVLDTVDGHARAKILSSALADRVLATRSASGALH